MKELILYLITFIFVYLIYLIFIVLRKKSIEKYSNSKEVKFLVNKYKLDIKKINMKKLANTIGLTNAFIISTTITIVSFIENYILLLLAGLVILVPLILIMYTILGKSLEKKYRVGDKNV